ncbi:hypothetical protein [Streptomyces griseosporeus]|uniref:hypothetical protein n=1 Tax=Streptomyces griseosporeus TaxID=1910 RepID=UPI0036F6F89C
MQPLGRRCTLHDVRPVALRAATVATMSARGVDVVRALVESSGAVEGGAGRSGPPEPSPGSAERVS